MDRSGQPVIPFWNKNRRKTKLFLFLLALPFIAHIAIFVYYPLWGWSMAFIKFSPGVPIFDSTFVGLNNFIRLLFNDRVFYRVLRNTVILNSLNLLASVFPLIIAMFLAEIRMKRFKYTVQTMISFPNYISWILVYGVFFMFMSHEGVINTILMSLGLTKEPLQFLQNSDWAYVLQTLITLWKGAGWTAIIYIAAISGLDQEVYEASLVDGANKFRRMWHVTLPGLMPTFIVLTILNVGNILSAFDQYFVFINPLVSDKLEVLDMYAYRIGIGIGNYSYATAIGMTKTLVSVVLLTSANLLAKWYSGKSIL